MNVLVFTGRLTKDLELKKSSINGVPYVQFTLAVRNSCRSNEADWIRLTAWRQNAQFLSQYCGKGDLIAVQAHMESCQIEDEKGRIYRTVNVVDRCQLLTKVHRDGRNGTVKENEPDLDPEQITVDAGFEQDSFSEDERKGWDDLPWE